MDAKLVEIIAVFKRQIDKETARFMRRVRGRFLSVFVARLRGGNSGDFFALGRHVFEAKPEQDSSGQISWFPKDLRGKELPQLMLAPALDCATALVIMPCATTLANFSLVRVV